MSDSLVKQWASRLSRQNRWLVLIVFFLTLIIGLALLFNWWPMLRGGFGWRWPYSAPGSEPIARFLPFVFALTIYLMGLRLLSGRAPWLYVAWCVFGTMLLSLTALMAQGDPTYLLFNRTISGLTTGGFTAAIRTDDFLNTLRYWPELMPSFESFSSHMAISPPGWPLSYAFLANLFDKVPLLADPLANYLRPLQCNDVPLMQLSNGQIASAWLGIASPWWAALTVIPLYDLGCRVGGVQLARRASAWWPLIPSIIMFLGTLSTPYPLGTVTVLWFFWLGLGRQAKGKFVPALVIAGALIGLLLFFSFAFLPFILFLGLFTLLYWQDFEPGTFRFKLRQPLVTGLLFGTGLFLIMILYTAVTGHTLLAIFESAMTYHFQLTRSYWPWLIIHLWDYALFLGLVLFLLALIGTFRFTEGPLRKMAVALNLTLLIVILSGTGRGETGRIWLFFAPFSLLIAAAVLNTFSVRYGRLLLVGQVFWLFVLLLVLRTVGGAYAPPPDLVAVRYPATAEPETVTAIDFGNELQLQGFSGQVHTDPASLTVDLYWLPKRPIQIPYFFSAVVVSLEGMTVADYLWQPFDYQFPTTCWYEATKQGPIIDRVAIPLPESEATGDHWLSLRMFSLNQAEEPLYVPITIPGVGSEEQVGLGPFRAGSPPG